MQQHLSQELAERYRRRTMSKLELIAADEHLASCDECREMLANQTDLSVSVDSLRVDLEKSVDLEHADYVQLEAYVDQTLSKQQREVLDLHFQSCRACAEELRDLRAFKEQFSKEALLEATGSALAVGSSQRRRAGLFFGFGPVWRTKSAWSLAACALVVLVVGLGVLAIWQQHSQTVVYNPKPSPTPNWQGNSNVSQNTLASFAYLAPELQAIVAKAIKTQQIPDGNGLGAQESFIVVKRHTVVNRGTQVPSPLLSPVGTVVASTTPLFRWAAVPGADGYRVQVSDASQNTVESSTVLTNTSWKSTKVLQRDATYIWRVAVIRNGAEVAESPLDVPQASFQVLGESQNQQLKELKRTHPQEHLARAILLAHAGVVDEADDELRAVPPSDPNYQLAQKFVEQLRAFISEQRRASLP